MLKRLFGVCYFIILCIGDNCSVDINECESDPCQYNGTCVDRVNGYVCECIPGITGINCETNIDECQSQPCRNNGSCIDLINGYCCFPALLYQIIFWMFNINTCSCSPQFSWDKLLQVPGNCIFHPHSSFTVVIYQNITW